MIHPDRICSVREVNGQWRLVRADVPIDGRVYPTREAACERARYLNGLEEHFERVLTETARIVQGLVQAFQVPKHDAEALVERALGTIRTGEYGDLSGRFVAAVGASGSPPQRMSRP